MGMVVIGTGQGDVIPSGLHFEFSNERFIAILHSCRITTFCIGGDVDVEADTPNCIDGFLVDDPA